MLPLIAHDLVKSYGDRVVLDGVSILAAPGKRVGIVGENGAGKSTLLRLLAGVEKADSGTVHSPGDVAYLPQEPTFADGATIRDVMAAALAPLHAAVRAVQTLSAAMGDAPVQDAAVHDPYARALEWAQHHDAWDAERRGTFAAHRLGLADVDVGRRVATLSGGQRSRLAMAMIITSRPECVLLDEPTNHLDDDAMALLEDFLVDLPGVVVAVSHDRVFLDRACTEIVDLDPDPFGTDGHGGTRYGGGFTAYLQHRVEARGRWERTHAEQQAMITGLRRASKITTSSVAHNRSPADNDKTIYNFKRGNVERTHARRVRDAARRLEVAEREQVRKPPVVLTFTAPLTGACPARPALAIRDLRVRGRVHVAHLDVPAAGRLLVTGANGSGKSSLLAVIDGRLQPNRGTVAVGSRRIGTLAQDVTFADPAASARLVFSRAVGDGGTGLAELGLLHPRDLSTPVGRLSVGQRRRLALAILVARAPDLLLLDEPTNHISPSLASELEDAFHTAVGTVIIASHDRWLRRRWSDQTLDLDAGRFA